MGTEDRLLEELQALRASLRRDNAKRGREPPVCSDEALVRMSRHPPLKESDLLAVEGFSESSVDRYGAEFLRLTRRYAVAAAGGMGIDAETARALRELQKRLVNLSRNNRLLFMPRTGTGVSADAGELYGGDALGLVLRKEGQLRTERSSGQPFRRLNSILREVNRSLREHGTYDLYVGYPFAEGMLPGEDGFQIRAPLALFPVTMDKRGDTITVEYDDSRDAVFNTTLILAFMKATGTKGDPADAVIEEQEDLGRKLSAFYSTVGLDLTIPDGISPLTEYRSGAFPEYAPGSFTVTPNLVLGRFPSYSSLIERDIDLMVNGGEVNDNLRNLLRGIYSGDFRSEYPLPLSAADLAAKGIVPRESDLFCINELDGAQEAALAALPREDGLVVQGPPGTGKSQLITAMIASAAASGKTVLMVSEKKTALDVVRSRLGPLSGYCMQIDDTADKEGFFRQLRDVMSAGDSKASPDLAQLSSEIDSAMDSLSGTSDGVFSPGDFGISPADLYSICAGTDTSSPLYSVYGKVPATLMNMTSADIDRMLVKFAEGRLTRSLRSYSNAVASHPWAEFLRPDLTEKDLAEMVADLGEIYQENSSVSKKGFIGKFLARSSLSRRASAMAAKYLTDYSRSDVEDLTSDPEAAAEFLEEYDMFEAHAADYRSLTSQERSWWTGMGNVSRKAGSPDPASGLRSIILNEHLKAFEEGCPALTERFMSADGTVSGIAAMMERKRELSRSAAESALSSYLREITDSKRAQDIRRISEQKRKWSIAKFAGRYGYELFRGIRIWLMTPEAVSETVPLEMGTFDLLVFDEASQMFTERGVPSIYRAAKTVVAGDHRQLRPTAIGKGRLSYDDEEDSAEEGSLLDLARSRYDSVLLNYHYRSDRSALIQFSDRAFYGGKLMISPDTEPSAEPPIEVVRVDGTWVDRTNPAEADEVVSLLRTVLTTRKDDETVGIIAFNIHQMNLISDRLEEECSADPEFGRIVEKEEARKDNGEDTGLFVKNVESVQGDERDIIIFSIGYAKDADGKFVQRFGWLNAAGGENRLNVAITRARKRIIIVQSFDPEGLDTEHSACKGPGYLKAYLTYAAAVSSGDHAKASEVLDSLCPPKEDAPAADNGFMDRLCEALNAEGFDTERDLRTGNYVMDIAVKRDGRYVLGIEDDRRVFMGGGTSRERDYHRRHFLASRGWNVVRTWTPSVLKDPEGEIRRIVEETRRTYSQSR